MGVRKSLAALSLAAAFGVGLLTSRALEGEARAQRGAAASAVFVPGDGIAFRTLDGRLIARLAYDAHGGFLELYDEHERSAGSVRGSGIGVAQTSPRHDSVPLQGAAPAPEPPALHAGANPDLGY